MPIRVFEAQWLNIQKFYLDVARGLFVTASTASSKCCRGMPIRVVLIDEASQIKKVDTLNAWGRHTGRLIKLAIFGDQNQLPATIPSFPVSEFDPAAKMSIMHRQIQAGHPHTMLLEQYRMHPHISQLVNMLVYDNRLTNNP